MKGYQFLWLVDTHKHPKTAEEDISRDNLRVSLYIFDIVLVIWTFQLPEQTPVSTSLDKRHPTVLVVYMHVNLHTPTWSAQTSGSCRWTWWDWRGQPKLTHPPFPLHCWPLPLPPHQSGNQGSPRVSSVELRMPCGQSEQTASHMIIMWVWCCTCT